MGAPVKVQRPAGSGSALFMGNASASRFARAVMSRGTYRSICMMWSAMWKYAPELPATITVEIPWASYNSRVRSINGVMGSISRWMTAASVRPGS